jgi:hypothetical protein
MNEPRIIPVGEEPPPLDDEPRHNGAGPRRDNPKGKAGSAKRRTGERFAVLNAFVDFTLAALSRNEIAVWLTLYRDTRDGTARTAMTDLARRAGCDKRTVVRVVKSLEARGLLKVVHRGGFRCGASRYHVRSLVT